mmetsp:Transcript_6775/g.9910  ORF Transcript_6775/g.9910 Transcript_6775/m.9910 type:complete len:93 (+) Transcript_6775:201-479(+)
MIPWTMKTLVQKQTTYGLILSFKNLLVQVANMEQQDINCHLLRQTENADSGTDHVGDEILHSISDSKQLRTNGDYTLEREVGNSTKIEESYS